MATTLSAVISIGQSMPDFDLVTTNPQVGLERVTAASFADQDALLVVFTCNHCPYAVHVEDSLVAISNEYQERGVAVLAICSNDAERYPADGPDAMARRAAAKDFGFPYAYDASQDVARAFGAVCTPDPFLFDRERNLVYHGRFDDSRPGSRPSDASELREALDQLLESGRVDRAQWSAVGCSIKWKP